MTHRLSYAALIAAIGFSLPACTSDSSDSPFIQEPECESGEELVEVTFTPNNNKLISRFTDSGFERNDMIDVWLVDDYDNFTNKKSFTYNGSNFSPVTDTYIKKPNEELFYFSVCGPYRMSYGTIIVTGGKDDCLFTMLQTSETNVWLPYLHIFSKFRIRVTNCNKTVTAVELGNVYDQYHIKINTIDDTYASCEHFAETMPTYKDYENYPYYCYVPPMNYLPEMKLWVVCGSTRYGFSFSYSLGYTEENELRYITLNMASYNSYAARSSEGECFEGAEAAVDAIEAQD